MGGLREGGKEGGERGEVRWRVVVDGFGAKAGGRRRVVHSLDILDL